MQICDFPFHVRPIFAVISLPRLIHPHQKFILLRASFLKQIPDDSNQMPLIKMGLRSVSGMPWENATASNSCIGAGSSCLVSVFVPLGLAYATPSVGPVGTGAQSGPLSFQSHKDVSAEEKRKAPVEYARRSRPANIGKGSIGRIEEAIEVAYLK
jgi:hypothetical protein